MSTVATIQSVIDCLKTIQDTYYRDAMQVNADNKLKGIKSTSFYVIDLILTRDELQNAWARNTRQELQVQVTSWAATSELALGHSDSAYKLLTGCEGSCAFCAESLTRSNVGLNNRHYGVAQRFKIPFHI